MRPAARRTKRDALSEPALAAWQRSLERHPRSSPGIPGPEPGGFQGVAGDASTYDVIRGAGQPDTAAALRSGHPTRPPPLSPRGRRHRSGFQRSHRLWLCARGLREVLLRRWRIPPRLDSGEDWERVQITADQCPRISAEHLAAERIRLGDALHRQEYFGTFVSAPGSVFDAEVLAHMFGDDA